MSGGSAFDIVIHSRPDVMLLRATGTLDSAAETELGSACRTLIEGGRPAIAELTDVGSCSPECLDVLDMTARRLATAGTALVLATFQPAVLRSLHAAILGGPLVVVADYAAALRYLDVPVSHPSPPPRWP
jgi:hypothetical protein